MSSDQAIIFNITAKVDRIESELRILQAAFRRLKNERKEWRQYAALKPWGEECMQSGEAAFLQLTKLSGGAVFENDISDAEIEAYILGDSAMQDDESDADEDC